MRIVWRWLTLFGYFGLLVVLSVHLLHPHFETGARSLLLLIVIGPLLTVLRGLVHGRPGSHIAASLLALVYFAGGVAVMAGGGLLPGGLETAFSLLLFGAALGYARCTRQA